MRTTDYDDLVCFAFYRGWRLVQDIYGDVLDGGLTPQRLYVLGLCLARDRAVGELAAALQIDSTAISNLVRRMEADGLLQRQKARDDRRSVRVRITPQGRATIEERNARIETIDRRIEASLPEGGQATLLSIVDRLEELARVQAAA